MPQTIYCDEEDGQEAAFSVSNLMSGEQVFVCAEHWGPWIRTMAEALGPGPQEMPPAEAGAGAAGAGEVGAANGSPRPRRRQSKALSAQEALTSEASPFPDPTPDHS